jgi:hypothetical protein
MKVFLNILKVENLKKLEHFLIILDYKKNKFFSLFL